VDGRDIGSTVSPLAVRCLQSYHAGMAAHTNMTSQ
jgi:hypothetical protein